MIDWRREKQIVSWAIAAGLILFVVMNAIQRMP